MSMRGLLLLCIWIIMGCSAPSSDTDKRIAKVGNRILTLSQAIESISPGLIASDSLAAIEQYREDWIRRAILLNEADRLGIKREPEIKARLIRAEEELLLQFLQESLINKLDLELTVTEEEARLYYTQHKDQFRLNERFIRFRHVETETQEAAEQAQTELMRGTPWETVANRYVINGTSKIRRSEQFWPESIAMSDYPEMERFLGVIGLTEISPTRLIDDTYHFVQLIDEKTAGEHPDLEWLLSEIQEWLALEKKRKAYNTYVQNLYLKNQANNEIEVFSVSPLSTQ